MAAATTLPLVVATLPGIPDLHSHIARYHVAAFGDDPFLSRYYEYRWILVGNLGVDLIAYPLTLLFGAEVAGRLAVGLIVVVSALAIFALSRAVWGRVPPQALFALCLIWSFPLVFGFVNFALGVALALLGAAAWIALRNRASGWRYPLALVLVFAIWLSHMSALGVYLVIVGSWELAERWCHDGFGIAMIGALVRDLAPQCWPMVFSLSMGGGGLSLVNPLADKPLAAALTLRSTWLVFDVGSIALIGLLTLALIGFAFFRRHRIAPGILVAAVALAIFFIVLPPGILAGSWYSDSRLLPVGTILGLLVTRGPTGRAANVLALAGLALFGARTIVLADSWADRSAAMEAELALLEPLPQGVRIAVFAYDSFCDEWPLMGYEHLANRMIVRRQAFANTQWDLPINSLTPIYNRQYGMNDGGTSAVPDPNPGFGSRGCRGRPLEERLAAIPPGRFDYVWSLVGPVPKGVGPALEYVGHKGRGWLYRIR